MDASWNGVEERTRRDKNSAKQLFATGGLFVKPNIAEAARKSHKEPTLERQSLEEAIVRISNYAASKNQPHKPVCIVRYAAEGNPLRDTAYSQLIKDLKKAHIRIFPMNADTPFISTPDAIILTVMKTGLGLEARLEKPGQKPKPFLPHGYLYCDEVIRLVRELYSLDQREEELQKITSEFQCRRLGM